MSFKYFFIVSLILIAIFFTIIRIDIYGQEIGSITYLGASKYYANYSSACIIRVDDFVADPAELTNITFHMKDRTVTYQNYQMDLISYLTKNHPEARLVFGIITGDMSGQNNSEIWSLYSQLVYSYGWEAASHTRYHLLPPRSIDDIEGSIKDIEGNITGYKVYTYIPPYGKVDKTELNLLKKSGIQIVMSDKPFQIRAPSHWYDFHITLKVDGSHPWFLDLLRSLHFVSNRIGGMIIIYTHATSFDWKNPSQMINTMEKSLSVVEDGKTWITVPSELYKYTLEIRLLKVVQINETSFDVSLKRQPDFQPIPITLKFHVEGEVRAVYFNGTLLPKLDSFGFIPVVGYKQIGNVLLVSVIPGGIIQIDFGAVD